MNKTIQYNIQHINPNITTNFIYYYKDGTKIDYSLIPEFDKIHQIIIKDRETGEIIEEFLYNWIYWEPFTDIFEKYQKQHKKFDIIEDGTERKRLFRKYQQTEKGSWIKKPYYY